MPGIALPTLLRLLSTVLLLSRVAHAISYGFPYGSTKVRGVNLGGWLVLEPWITPSLFDHTGDHRVIDEFTLGKYVPAAKAKATLKNHWDTWITERDFIGIKQAGLNHVRLPVGYWAYDPDGSYISGQAPYVDKAVGWARRHGLKVILDIHGLPGSQNGFDNSGRLGNATWHTNANNIRRSNALVSMLAKRYARATDVVTTIAPVNEPASYKDNGIIGPLKQYYKDSWGTTRYPNGARGAKGNALVLIHDAFKPLESWNGFLKYPEYDGVAIDTHIYQVFSNQKNAMSEADHVRSACSQASTLAKMKSLWVIVGEWTTSPNDCAKYLNSRFKGARYDGSFPGSPRVGSCANLTGDARRFSSAYKTTLRKMWEAQTHAYEAGGIGWIYWTWKTEQAPEWSYSAGVAGGWIPRNPNDRKYPHICG